MAGNKSTEVQQSTEDPDVYTFREVTKNGLIEPGSAPTTTPDGRSIVWDTFEPVLGGLVRILTGHVSSKPKVK